jgi:hypothetical protein
MPFSAKVTFPARQIEIDYGMFSNDLLMDRFANFDHLACHLMTRDVGESFYGRMRSGTDLEIRSTNPTGAYPNDRFISTGCRDRTFS